MRCLFKVNHLLGNNCELKACFVVFSAYENPDLVAQCGGIGVLLRKILDCHQYPRINESLVSTILHLVNFPATRHFIRYNTDLEVGLLSELFITDACEHWSSKTRQNFNVSNSDR